MREYEPLEWIRTGIPAIDLVIGSGIPRGRAVEITGEPSAAKSALGYAIIAAFQRAGGKCVLIDSEAKAERSFVERFGVNFGDLAFSRGANIKKVCQIFGRVAQMADPAVPALIVWDSLAATPGAEELELHVSEKEFTGEKAARARYLSAAFRAVCNELTNKKVTLIVINQLRTKFNFMGHSSMEAPGGKAPKYHAAVRLLMKDIGKIQAKDTDVIIGITALVKNIKNQCSQPFRHCTVRFRFDTGFDMYSGLDELLIRHKRIADKAGWLAFGDKTFRSGDIERIITEIPDLVAPLTHVVESEDSAQDTASSVEGRKEPELPATEEAPKEGEAEA